MKRRLMWQVRNNQGDEMLVFDLTPYIVKHWPNRKRVLVLRTNGE